LFNNYYYLIFAGDYLFVACTNPPELVNSIAARLLVDLDDIVTVEKADGIPDSEGKEGRREIDKFSKFSKRD
jgi:hypothetical protein